jgi:hypothetical protein
VSICLKCRIVFILVANSSVMLDVFFRSLQSFAFPRKTQTQLDLYISSIHGLNGVTVTIKMKTYKSFNSEAPDMDIQLVLEPPLSD